MNDHCYLGLDVGTSSAKAMIVDSAGEVLASASAAYSCSRPRPGWSEADPADWWKGCVEAITRALGACPEAACGLAGIGLTGQMHGLVCLDGNGTVLRPAILWNDQRTDEECGLLNAAVGVARYNQLAGSPALPGFTAPKMLWVQRHEPAVWSKVKSVVLPKDYIRWRLTGELATDVADASGIGLLDVGRRQWSDELCAACGINAAILPRLLESTEVSGHLTAAAADSLGLAPTIPVVAGAGDQAASAVGCGVVDPGGIACSLGTSGVLFAPSLKYTPEPDGRLHAFCAASPQTWHWMGVQLSCAGSLDWLVNSFLGLTDQPDGQKFEQLLNSAAGIAPGCDGLTFLPYLSGERTPHPDPHARGAFVGLTLTHSRAHAVRSVIEGVSFGLHQILDLLKALGLSPAHMVVTGGGARSPFWLQLLADLMQVQVVTVKGGDGGAFGAAVLAATGTGDFASVREAAKAMVQTGLTIGPKTDGSEYAQPMRNFAALYDELQPAFGRTARCTA